MNKEAELIISKLNLNTHPEGGFYNETYRATEIIEEEALPSRYSGGRSISTSIYFLLEGNQCSKFHKIKSDEIWHFYKGSPLIIYSIKPDGTLKQVKLGNNLDDGEIPQYIIPAGYWFAAHLINKNHYALIGCTVAPGFEFADFELADKNYLIKAFPQHKSVIDILT